MQCQHLHILKCMHVHDCDVHSHMHMYAMFTSTFMYTYTQFTKSQEIKACNCAYTHVRVYTFIHSNTYACTCACAHKAYCCSSLQQCSSSCKVRVDESVAHIIYLIHADSCTCNVESYNFASKMHSEDGISKTCEAHASCDLCLRHIEL
jgi:hypothetical protein